MRILITGGTGLIGRPLSAALVADGHEVIVLTRNPIEVRGMPDGVNLHRWDARSATGWSELADGSDAIINLAGAGIADARWTPARKRLIRESRIHAGHAVMEALRAAKNPPQTLVQASAVGYYGTFEDDTLVDETSSPGDDFLAKVCFDWEISTAPASRMGIRRPVARTGIVLSNDGGAFPNMKLPFRFFMGGKLGDGEQWLPWIHIEDEVRALKFLLENKEADGPINLAAPNPVTNQAFSAQLAEAMGRPAFVPAPALAMRTALGEMATLLLDGQRVVPSRLLELGFDFQYPELENALSELISGRMAMAA